MRFLRLSLDPRTEVGLYERAFANRNRTLFIPHPGGAASGSISDSESAIMNGEQVYLADPYTRIAPSVSAHNAICWAIKSLPL